MKKIILISFVLLLFSAIHSNAAAKVVLIKVDGGIGPAAAAYIDNSIEYATEKKAMALIIELNTPGGLLESTRDIVTSLLEAEIPVIVFVAPGGSRAGSAGVFITLAANIAVMAPGTNIGAAHPVGIGGDSDSSSVMYDKVTNDAAAFMRTIAQKRDRNVEWAELAVRESISATENEALLEGAIDLICPNIDSLLRAVDGWKVETADKEVTLKTKKVTVEFREKDWREELLGFLSDPNIAYIFMMLAMYGIMFELYNPGSIFPGVVGGISAILAGYSLQMLPINYAGLGLILLGVILFIVEIKVTSYGMLTIGGIISLFLGSVFLIDSPFEFMSISMSIIITAVVLTSLFFIIVIGLGLRAQTNKRASGKEAMIDETGVAIEDITPNKKGNVKVHGEIWKAVSDHTISAGDSVVVEDVRAFLIKVKPEK